jgi:hypothetical protein
MYWGGSYWRFIHLFALHDKKDLVLQVKNFIPCEECKSEWYDPAPNETLLDWSREFHNKVNRKLGRYDKWDATDLNISHKATCDVCENKEYVHNFPWIFIHEVAKQPNSMEFLKEFNEQYPCELHKGMFLLEEPLPDESTLNWTLRNHTRIDASFTFNQQISTDLSGTPLSGITGVPCTACPTHSSNPDTSTTTTQYSISS